MFRNTHLFGALLMVSAVPFFLACDDDPVKPASGEPMLEWLTMPESVTLEVGQSVRLRLSSMDQESARRGIQWSSSDPGIVSVSDRGVAEAKAEGTAVITAQCGLFCVSATVTVIQNRAAGAALDD